MNSSLALTQGIIFVLTFLAYTISFINGHPNAFSWTPKNYEDDVGSRSFSHDDVPTYDFEELDDEQYLNDLGADLEDEFFENFMQNNKRSPNSIGDKSFKNKAGYYLIEGPNHTITGTSDLLMCQKSGVFQVGRTTSGPFIKNKNSKWYLAINVSGRVYMRPTESDDTKIHTSINNDLSVNLYRIVKTVSGKNRLYLDLNPQASTVDFNSSSVTSKFEVRGGKITC